MNQTSSLGNESRDRKKVTEVLSRIAHSDKRKAEAEEAKLSLFEQEPVEGLELALDLKSLTALARNALASFGDSPLAPQTQIKLTTTGQSLARDGCDYIEGINLFLAVRGCWADAHDFVVTLAGMSGGNSEDYFKATDEQLAARMNCSTKTVARKRKALIGWSRLTKFAVVQIKEGDYDYSISQNAPTEYRMPIIEKAEKIVKWARQNTLMRSPRAAISEAAYKELDEYVAQEAENLPEEVVTQVRNRKKKKQKERMTAAEQFEVNCKTMLKIIAKRMEDASALGLSVSAFVIQLHRDIDKLAEEKGDS